MSSGDTTAVHLEVSAATAVVTLTRPPVNVLDIATIGVLRAALEEVAARKAVKVVVLRSGLAGTFSAGVDIKDHTRDRVSAMLESFHGVFRVLDRMPQVALAAVDGRCLGGGCELATFCDVVLATPRSVFGQPEIDVGCFPPLAAVLLPRIAYRAAFEMILTGAPIDAVEAARIGLVTRVVEDLDAEVERWTVALAAKSGAVLALARRAVRRGGEGHMMSALEEAERLYREALLPTADLQEGVDAFLEKRPPRWRDE